MAKLPKALAEEIGKARVAGGGNYIQHGDYVLMIKKWFYQKIQDECIILELVVVESKPKVVYEGEKKVEEEPNPAGSECSSAANFDGEGKLSARSNSRAPVLGLFGLKENEVADLKVTETLEYVCDDNTPAAGMLLSCSTFSKEIRSRKGSYITGLSWGCVSKPGIGINAPEAVKSRLDAYTTGGGEALVKLGADQLAMLRGAGTIAAAPTNGAAPSLPNVAPPLPTPPADPMAGWTMHPQNPEYYYRGTELKKKSDLLA